MIIPQADGTRATQAGEAIQASQADRIMAISQTDKAIQASRPAILIIIQYNPTSKQSSAV